MTYYIQPVFMFWRSPLLLWSFVIVIFYTGIPSDFLETL